MARPFYTDGPGVELYDTLHQGSHADPMRGDVVFYRRQARLTGGPILELGCGTGRVTLPLARDGWEVVGLDLAPAMLAIARRKARRLPATSRVRCVRGDMERFDLGRRFRLILIPFRAFQVMLTPEAQRRCLGCVRRHLHREGRLIVNIFDPRLEMLVPETGQKPRVLGRLRHPLTGRRFVLRSRDRIVDPLTQMFEEVWEWTEHGAGGRVLGRRRDLLRLRWTYRYEMKALLESCGLKILACYGDFMGGPPRYAAEQIWVAERAGR